MNRKQFLSLALTGTTGAVLGLPSLLIAQKPPKPPSLEAELVKEFVGKSHNNLDRVRELLGNEPNLLNATWDHGGGDFESGLNAAGHVGYVELANFLLEKGARADLFVMTMLGKTALVKAILVEFPAMLNSLGPHGFTLLHHAKRGGEHSAELLEFFQAQGLTVDKVDLYKK